MKNKMKVSKSYKKKPEKNILEDMEEIMNKFFQKMDKLFTKEWGQKCKEYNYLCVVCRIWDIYERFKKDLELEYLKK